MLKKSIYILSVLIFFYCGEEQQPLELFSAEAFAFSLEPGWELNASVRVKNFRQENEGDKYLAKLSYIVDLKKPSGEIIENVDGGVLDESSDEEMQELVIELQLELTEAYELGKYYLMFDVTDDLTSQNDTLIKPFILSAD